MIRVLTDSVKNNTQVLINCRNNKKLLGRVKAFDRLNSFLCNQLNVSSVSANSSDVDPKPFVSGPDPAF